MQAMRLGPFFGLGKRRQQQAARMAMMAMTTSSSISVKPSDVAGGRHPRGLAMLARMVRNVTAKLLVAGQSATGIFNQSTVQ